MVENSDLPAFGSYRQCPKCNSKRFQIDNETLKFSIEYVNSNTSYHYGIRGEHLLIGCDLCGFTFREQVVDRHVDIRDVV